MRWTAFVAILCALAACGSGNNEASGAGGSSAPTGSPAGALATAPAASPGGGAAGGAASTTLATTPGSTAKSNPSSATMPAQMSAAATPGQAQAPASTPANIEPPAGGKKLAMDECNLHTKYPGDQYCILPPPADKGFQFHIGPSDYENPDPKYVLQPGEENVVNLAAPSGNDKDVMYYYRQYRMRPGSHHVILSVDGKRIGGTQNLARDQPDFGIIPPENQDVGLPLKARSQINANMHFYNYGDKPIIRELWVNYWYKDPAEVKQAAISVFSMTGVSAAVAHSHVVVGASCPVSGNGRALSLYGHRHLNNVRFSIWHNSGGKKDLVFEDYDSEHPSILDYNSLTTNMAPNPTAKTVGGASGILSLKQGDTLDFECEIVNNTNKNFFGANEAADDEMCILVGDTVGATVSAGCTPIAAKKLN